MIRALFTVGLTFATLTAPSFSEDATLDALVTRMRDDFESLCMKNGRPDKAGRDAFLKEHLGDTAAEELPMAQLQLIASITDRSSADGPVMERVREFVNDDGTDGAYARSVLAIQSLNDRSARDQIIADAITHPSFAEVLLAGDSAARMYAYDPAWHLMVFVTTLSDEMLDHCEHSLEATLRRLTETKDVAYASHVKSFAGRLVDMNERLSDKGTRRMSELIDTYCEAIVAQSDRGAKYAEWLGGHSKALAAPHLIGREAPSLDIIWDSEGEQYTSLQDLRGKVVLLDFWSSFCGPCIAEFPGLRLLNERYEDDDFVILGVTSLQGRHRDPEHGIIDCRGDAEKEMGLMKRLMGQLDMTWPVVFSKQPVINPDFSGSAIPHKVIIDKDGIIRALGVSGVWHDIGNGQSEERFDNLHSLIDELL